MSDQSLNIICTILNDQRVSATQLSIYLAMLVLYQTRGIANKVNISRKEIMLLAKINSFCTYHKAITCLKKFDYIDYIPSYHPNKKTTIIFLK
jgi:hypothetical protein